MRTVGGVFCIVDGTFVLPTGTFVPRMASLRCSSANEYLTK